MRQSMNSNKIKIGLTLTLMGILSAGLSCTNSVLDNTQTISSSLDNIETVNFQDLSITQPISVEEATLLAEQQISEPNQQKDTLELTLAQVRAATITVSVQPIYT